MWLGGILEVFGYKAFNKGLIDMYGNKMELNRKYSVEGPILWNSSKGGNGYHFCTYMEDCFSYFNGFEGDIDITEVKGSGRMTSYDDDYRGNYDMYVSESIEIIRILPREEIINYFLNKSYITTGRFAYSSLEKFITGYPLTDEERQRFLDRELDIEFINNFYSSEEKRVYCKRLK